MPKDNCSSIVAIFAIAMGCLVLLGWRLDIAFLKGAVWQLPVISPFAALTFIFAGISLLLLKTQSTQSWHRTLGRGCALAVVLACGFILIEYYLISTEGFLDPLTAFLAKSSPDNAKPSPYVAFGLLLIGLALLLLDFTSRRGHYPAQWLALGAILIEIFTITSFSYGIVPLANVFHSAVKPHSGLIIILLGCGILSARHLQYSVISRLRNHGPAGLMLRQLLPFVVLGPMVLGWFKIWGQHAGLFSETSGEALIALTGASLFSVLLWRVARKLEALDIQQAEAVALFHDTLETAPDGIIVCNDQHQILLVNEQTEKMFGYARSELLGKAVEVLIPEQLRDAHTRHKQSYLQQPRMRSMGKGLNILGRHKDGSLFSVEIALSPHQYQGRLIVTAVVRDITERKQNEEALKRQQRALSMLSTGNRTLLHSQEADEAQLLQTMCQVAVEVGDHRMAWVGYKVDDEQKSVRQMAQAGFEHGYLERAAISWGENERGQGPTGLAVRTGQIQIAKNFATDPRMAPWREDALKRGYSSSISLPLKDKEEVLGALTIYSDNPDAFDEMEVPILDEMAADLSFGIITLRNNIAREKAESDLKASYSMLESTLESTADGIVVTSLTGDILKYNQRFADIWSLPTPTGEFGNCDQLVTFACIQVSDAPGFIERTNTMYKMPAAAFKDVIELKDGRVIERIGQPHYMDGEVVGRVCSLRDITEQRKHESQLTYLANHDALTGLPNRNLLNDRLSQAIAYSSRSEKQLALLFLDLDRFKLINDGLGHNFGDRLLIEIAKRISECLRDEDTVARMGGDEFVILVTDLEREEDVAAVALKLLASIARPCNRWSGVAIGGEYRHRALSSGWS